MQNKRQLGDAQEIRAVKELENAGYHIIQRNFRCRIGEIDIVAEHKEYLVFIEVKYRKDQRKGYAAEAVNWKKQQVISRVADYYIQSHYQLFPAVRFDVVALEGEQVMIYENAFDYIPRGKRR